MENTMEKTTVEVKETEEKISMTYQGIIYAITKQEFESLQNGWVTFKEMFG